MISHGLKRAYYTLLGCPMWMNGCIYRNLRAPRSGMVKVHLGPGQRNYREGWINVDANILSAKIDVWSNVLHGLPFHDETVDVFYSHHVVEHLPDRDLPSHFREMYRCLKPGGAIRVGGPNGDSAARKLVEGDADWFGDFPDNRQSVGGRFVNFILCRAEHLTILTETYLNEIATGAGFTDVRACRSGIETRFPEYIDASLLAMEDQDHDDLPHTLLVEAVKEG